MKEIRRRVMSDASEGIACGPVSVYAVDAEIVVEDEGKEIYLHTQWVDEAGDMVLFEATTESLYDVYEEFNQISFDDHEAFDSLVEKRNRLQEEADVSRIFGDIDIFDRYEEQYDQLLEMMQEKIDQDGMDYNLFEDEEDLEDWEEDEEEEIEAEDDEE